MNHWYGDNPNCGRCGNLNGQGFCSLTACIFPAICESTTLVVKPKTNADRIRSMTDEELAEWIAEKAANHGGGCCAPGCYDCSIHPEGCVGPWLDWLRQEAKI